MGERGLEDRPTRPAYRGGPGTEACAAASAGQLRQVCVVALGAHPASCVQGVGVECAGTVAELAAPLWPWAAVGRDLCGSFALCRHLLPGRQLAARGSDPRACQT